MIKKYLKKLIEIKNYYEKCYENEIFKIINDYIPEEKVQNDYEEDSISKEIKEAKLYKLIDTLLENKKENFRDEFFFTYRSFTTPYYFLNDLISRFNSLIEISFDNNNNNNLNIDNIEKKR
jgi:hypothetical protein